MARDSHSLLSPEDAEKLPDKVLEVLQNHKGSRRPITATAIARRLKMYGKRDDRKIQLAIRELISRKHPIGSSVRNPMGYFMIASRKEADDYLSSLRSRAVHTLERLKEVRAAVSFTFGDCQLELPLELAAEVGMEL